MDKIESSARSAVASPSALVVAENFIVEAANEGDLPFIADALMYSERAHTGIGIWDIVLGSENTRNVMEIAASDETCHFHWSKFMVIRDKATKQAVAGACGFRYPDFGVVKSMTGISKALQRINSSLTDKDCQHLWKKIDFIYDSFPDLEEDQWYGHFVEAVYTCPEYRGQGFARKIVGAVLDQARAEKVAPIALITCAVGNNTALHVYKSLGYQDIGHGDCDACMTALGCPGFHILRQSLTR